MKVTLSSKLHEKQEEKNPTLFALNPPDSGKRKFPMQNEKQQYEMTCGVAQ